ncbi:MAG: hypothetical protein WBV94_29620 [Blastocatellia bacterium]
MSKSLAIARREETNQELTFLETKDLGALLASSGYFADVKEASQAVVKILTGREMGIGPMASMSGIYVIQGKPSLSANLMASTIKRSGKYDYRIREHTNEVCKIEFFQSGESLGESSFSIEDAKQAESLSGKNAHSWKKFPRNMLFARAMSNGARFFTPDIFGGPVYDPEELGAGLDTQTGEYIPTATTERKLAGTKSAPVADPTMKNVTPPEDERTKLNREIGVSLDTLVSMKHPNLNRKNGDLKQQILEHVRGISLDRGWDYEKLNSLADLSVEHLGEYAGILEGEIQALKEEQADRASGIDPNSETGI